MTTVFEIPTAPKSQTFAITLVGVTYNLTFVWNVPSAAWLVSIADEGNNPILSSIPLVTGADLLGQFAYLGIGGQLIVQTDNDPNAVPTYQNLGSTGHLFFVAP